MHARPERDVSDGALLSHQPGECPGTKTVLVVDDDAAMRTAVAAALSAEGLSVVECSHGADALDFLRAEGAVSLIVTDLLMPVMNGWELLSALRAHGSFREIPLVLLSDVSPHDPRCCDLAAVFQCAKPFRLDYLAGLVGAVLEDT